MGLRITAVLALALLSCQRESAGGPDAAVCGTLNSCAQPTTAGVTRLPRLATTPGLEWTRELAQPGSGSPDAPILLEAKHQLAVTVSSRELWLLDTADGAGDPIFRVGWHNSVGNAAADNDETLYAATSSMVMALTPQGQTRWLFQVPTREPNVGPPPSFAVSPAGVFVASRDGNLYKLDRSDGHVLWSAALDLSGYNSLAGSHDTVYVGTDRGVLAVDASTGALRWRSLACLSLGINMLTRSHALVSRHLDGITVGSGLDACGQHSFELPAWHRRILELSDGSTALMVGAPIGARDHLDHLAPDGSVLERIELGLAELRGQVRLQHADLRRLLGDEVGAAAGLELRDGLAALLDHLLEHCQHLRVVERDALVDFTLLDGCEDQADGGETVLVPRAHGALHVFRDAFFESHA